MTVVPGAIVLEAGPLLRRLTSVPRLVHINPSVTLIRTRLAPPWFDTSLVLTREDGTGIATTWLGARRRLRKTLHAAGFVVNEVTTWISLGGNWVND